MKWLWTIIVIALVLVLGVGYYSWTNSSNATKTGAQIKGGSVNFPSSGEGQAGQAPQTSSEPATYTVEISSNGFSPEELKINRGDKVIFLSVDEDLHRPASNIHPTHKLYPGSGIEKCDTNEKNLIFDACRSLNQGESFSFTFNEAGTWNYHDHLLPRIRGTITVK